MEFDLEKINKKTKHVLDNILELYQHEFNEFYNYFDDLNEEGRYDFIKTDKYILDENYNAYLIKVNSKIAGFVMLNPETKYVKNGTYIAEFYIMPKYRKGYFSINVIKEILKIHAGEIELKVLKNNKKAYKLYEKLFKRLVTDVKINIVQEYGDDFLYYNFNTKNLNF